MSAKSFTVATTWLYYLLSSCMPVCLSGCSLHTAFWNIHRSSVLTASVWLLHGWSHLKPLPSRRMFCVHNKTMHHLQCHIIRSHILRMHLCLAVTCYLHFWQNDRDLLGATTVSRGWNGYRNKSQHRKLTLEKKILPPLLSRLEPANFRIRAQNSTTETLSHPTSSPAPQGVLRDDVFKFCCRFYFCEETTEWYLKNRRETIVLKSNREAVSQLIS